MTRLKGARLSRSNLSRRPPPAAAVRLPLGLSSAASLRRTAGRRRDCRGLASSADNRWAHLTENPHSLDMSRGEVGGAGEVIRRAGGGLAEDNDFGGSAAEADGERVGEVALGVRWRCREGQLLGYPERSAPGQDGDLGHGVGVLVRGRRRGRGRLRGRRRRFLPAAVRSSRTATDQEPVPGRHRSLPL